MMENITDAIFDLQNRSTYLDEIKSTYMLTAQELMIALFSLVDGFTPESEEKIEFYLTKIIFQKELLLIELDKFIETVKLLDNELGGDD